LWQDWQSVTFAADCVNVPPIAEWIAWQELLQSS